MEFTLKREKKKDNALIFYHTQTKSKRKKKRSKLNFTR